MKVAILDAGSQYLKLIDKKIRKLNVETETFPLSHPLGDFDVKKYRGIIISGSPMSVISDSALCYDRLIFKTGVPILGICYGMQLIVHHFEGTVAKIDSFRNDATVQVRADTDSPLYKDIPDVFKVLLTHGDCCVGCPETFTVDIKTPNNISYGISNISANIYGVQFHPEVDLTEFGDQIFKNFLFKICKIEPSFTLQNRLESKILELQNLDSTMGDCMYVVFVSGGVDSLVAVKLMLRAFPSTKILAVHINTGFMRLEESESVLTLLKSINVEVMYLNCTLDFLNGSALIETAKDESQVNLIKSDEEGIPVAYDGIPIVLPAIYEKMKLCDAINPEHKRVIIGDIFMKIYNEHVIEKCLNGRLTVLVQGTLRPDLIESASKLASSNADTIKTHHNDSPEVRKLRKLGKVVEPLKDFHKDEVRQIGLELELDDSIINRQPFPGPGLAVRILCANNDVDSSGFTEAQGCLDYLVNYQIVIDKKLKNPEMKKILKIFSKEEKEHIKSITNHEKRLFCHIIPVKSVGIQGDERTYKNVVVLSSNGKPNFLHIAQLVRYILRLYGDANRVCYALGEAITDEAITCLTRTRICPYTVELVRRADSYVNEVFEKHGEMKKISQMPVILIPVHFNKEVGDELSLRYSIVLRPVITRDFMTAEAAIPSKDISVEVLDEVNEVVTSKLCQISKVLIDLTSKPPGTIEWE